MITQTMLNETDLMDLISSGINEEIAKQVGYFSATKERAQQLLGYSLEGLIFKYFNPFDNSSYSKKDGSDFCRIKPRGLKGKNRFDKPPKYLSPRDEGCKPYFSSLISPEDYCEMGKRTSIPIILTEGEKTSDKAVIESQVNEFDLLVIGLAGISGWTDRTPRLGENLAKEEGGEFVSRPIPELFANPHISWAGRKVFIGFDSDIYVQKNALWELEKLARQCNQLKAEPFILRLPNQMDGSKNGIDDFLVRYGWDSLLKLIKISEPALKWEGRGKEKRLEFDRSGTSSLFTQVTMMSCVLKEMWRYRTDIGWYQWNGNVWELASDELLEKDVQTFREAQGWKEVNHTDIILSYLQSALLEKNWSPQHLLVFSNGFLDCSANIFTGKQNKELLCTEYLDYPYEPLAKCPNFRIFMKNSFHEDTDAVDILRSFMKWILSPKLYKDKYPIEKSLDIIGDIGTGKGTFLQVIQGLTGDSHAAFDSTSFETAEEMVNFLDKKVIIDCDANPFLSKRAATNICKAISNEELRVRNYYKGSSEQRLRTTLVRALNEPCKVKENTPAGLFRRIIPISFNRKPSTVDIRLGDRLRDELPGIFQWVWSLPLETAFNTLTRLPDSKALKSGMTQFIEANNHEFRFLTETFPGGGQEQASEIYAKYKSWWKENEPGRAKGMKAFFLELKKLGCQQSRQVDGSYYRFPSAEILERNVCYDTLGIPLVTTPASEENAIAQVSPAIVPVSENAIAQVSPIPTPVSEENAIAQVSPAIVPVSEENAIFKLNDWVTHPEVDGIGQIFDIDQTFTTPYRVDTTASTTWVSEKGMKLAPHPDPTKNTIAKVSPAIAPVSKENAIAFSLLTRTSPHGE